MDGTTPNLKPLTEISYCEPFDPKSEQRSPFNLLWEILSINAGVAFSKRRHGPPNSDGDVETLHGVDMTHHFIDAPADGATIEWHYVEAGEPRSDRPTLVFLHGMPESWFMWTHQMAAFAPDWHCIAPDLRGYGQSSKAPGDYRQEGVGDQVYDFLKTIGVEKAVIITHDRGTVIADYMIANHPDIAAGYIRGEQHLVHFHPSLAPQEMFFLDPVQSRKLAQTWLAIPNTYHLLTDRRISLADRVRAWREWDDPAIAYTTLRYFYSSSFEKEWRDRRERLIEKWLCPILILQGEHDGRQPKKNYVGIEPYFHDAEVRFVDAGHVYVTENPSGTTEAMADFLERKILGRAAV